jgi:hypothetical protein
MGLVIWRRDRRLWLFGALGLVAVVLSLGGHLYWTPTRWLVHIPLVQNVVPNRFAALTSLCAAIMLGIVVGHTHHSVAALWSRRASPRGGERPTASSRRRPSTLATAVAAAAALAVGGVAVGSVLADEIGNVPYTTKAVVLPQWFAKVGPHLPPDQVVLTYPPPFSIQQSAEGWQAMDGLDFALVGGSGPESIPQRAGPERAGQEVLNAASFSIDGPPAPTPTNLGAVRRALAGWRVTTIVMPNPSYLARYDQGSDPAAALGLFTLAAGRAPTYVDQAWVWDGVRRLSASRRITSHAYNDCTEKAGLTGQGLGAVPRCVMAASHPTG